MADALRLDPDGYTGTYKLIGGSAALDFANLVSYRGQRRAHDWLRPTTNLRLWAEAVGLRVDPDDDIDGLRALRELLARVFLAVAHHDIPEPGDLDQLGALASAAAARRRLRYLTGAAAAVWVDERPRLVDTLALDATRILTRAQTLRIVSACDECQWLYLDATRNHSRRWCDPADCGNRARQRRHYYQTRSARP